MRIKVAGDWKISVPYAKVGTGWFKSKEALVKVNGAWKQFYLELSIALASNTTIVIDSYQYQRMITFNLLGTYGGTVTAARVSGSSSLSFTKTSDSQWTFFLNSSVGVQTAVYRFTYANALETGYVDVTITVSKVDPPPPPPPPPYVPPPYVPPPSGGGSGSGVIVDYPTYAKTFENYTWGVRNGPKNGSWWAEVSWDPNTNGAGSGRIPPVGQVLPLDANGATQYTNGRIPVYGYHRIIWHFSDGQTVTKYIYVPYYWQNFLEEYGFSQGQSAPISYYYTTRAQITVGQPDTGDPGAPRYGLYRAPDKGGLAYWMRDYVSKGNVWTARDVLTFSQSAFLNPIDKASTLYQSSTYGPGYWGGDFYDALPTRF